MKFSAIHDVVVCRNTWPVDSVAVSVKLCEGRGPFGRQPDTSYSLLSSAPL